MEVVHQKPFYIKSAYILISACLVMLILYMAKVVIVPLIFALFAAILLNPIVNFLVRKRVPRIVSIFIALLVSLIMMGTLIGFMSLQISMFSKTYPKLKEKAKVVSKEVVTKVETTFNIDDAKVTEWVNKLKADAMDGMTSAMGTTIMTVSATVVAIIIIPVYIFLILYYKFLILEFIKKLFNPKHHYAVADVLQSVRNIIQSYLLGLLIEGAIVAVLNSVGLLILGIEYAIILGITGAILNVIPYIGGIIAIALPMIVALVTKSWVSSLLVLAVYVLIQFIDNHYLIPYIVASKVKLNALIAIVVVLIGDLLWGIPGMFLSIPLTALIKVIFDHIETLKPWGFLLGDNVPPTIRLPFTNIKK
jgi:predicted PurR-regulated permease PerM